jgi:hypothetical protein
MRGLLKEWPLLCMLTAEEGFMKTRFFFPLAATTFLLLACSSTTTRRFEGSNLAPAAQGKVEYKKTANNNIAVDLNVKHLAPPKRVAENATTYVVWAQPTTGDTKAIQKIGALKLDDDLEGNLSTVLPYASFDLLVTAEPSVMTLEPSDKRVINIALTQPAD